MKDICGGRKITKNQTQVAKKPSNRYILELDHEKLNKNVTAGKFYTIFSNMFESKNESFTTIDEYKCRKTLTN